SAAAHFHAVLAPLDARAHPLEQLHELDIALHRVGAEPVQYDAAADQRGRRGEVARARSVGFYLEAFLCRVALTTRHDDFTAAHRRARAPSLHQRERHRDKRARGASDDCELEPLWP